MSLIEREPLLDSYDAAHKGPPGSAMRLIEEAPEVKAIPISWFEEHKEVIAVGAVLNMWEKENEK